MPHLTHQDGREMLNRAYNRLLLGEASQHPDEWAARQMIADLLFRYFQPRETVPVGTMEAQDALFSLR